MSFSYIRAVIEGAIVEGYGIGRDLWLCALPGFQAEGASPTHPSPRPIIAGASHMGLSSHDGFSQSSNTSRRNRLEPLPHHVGWKPPNTLAGERGTRSLAAQHNTQALKQDLTFWSNRMRLLRNEVQRQQAKQERSLMLRERTELSTFVNLSLKEQLEEERLRHETKLQEKIRTIREKKVEHKVALRSALKRVHEENQEKSRMSKLQGTNHARIIHNHKYENLVTNVEKKEKVQQEKIMSLLNRVRNKTRQEEEIHRNYEAKIQHFLENEKDSRQQIQSLVKQSADMVKKLRKFQEEGQLETDKIEAIRATAMLSSNQD